MSHETLPSIDDWRCSLSHIQTLCNEIMEIGNAGHITNDTLELLIQARIFLQLKKESH